eukprot:6063745-Pyramimonas_sp.AAC.1
MSLCRTLWKSILVDILNHTHRAVQDLQYVERGIFKYWKRHKGCKGGTSDYQQSKHNFQSIGGASQQSGCSQ